MHVAVVIPLYNGADWIGATLTAVVGQSHPPTEIVVVDDGSTDDGPSLAAGFPGVRVSRNPGNGSSPNRVFGLERTTAPLVCLLDQDDLWRRDHLANMVAALEADPRAVGAVADEHRIGSHDDPVWTDDPVEFAEYDPWDDYPFARVGGPSNVMLRRAALDAAGGWPTHLPNVADYFTWLNVGLHGRLRRTAARTVARRMHAASTSHDLRRTKLRHYLGVMRKAADELLARRVDQRPTEEEYWLQRRRLFDEMATMIDAVAARDWPTLRAAARAAERMTADGPATLPRRCLDTMIWFLDVPDEASDRPPRLATLLDLVDHWPTDAPRFLEELCGLPDWAPFFTRRHIPTIGARWSGRRGRFVAEYLWNRAGRNVRRWVAPHGK
ncbi:MAG: glycosyltransferase family 2 protein [Planctomycetia bacterium]